MSTRLGQLHDELDDLPRDEERAFRAYLLGSLSASVTDVVWESGLQLARELVEKERQRAAGRVVA